MRDFSRIRGINPKNTPPDRLAQYCAAADAAEEALKENRGAIQDCVGAFLAWQLLRRASLAKAFGDNGTVDYIYRGLGEAGTPGALPPAHEKAENILRDAVRSVVRRSAAALYGLGCTAGRKRALDLADRLMEDVSPPLATPLESLMPEGFWLLSVSGLLARYGEAARGVQAEKERYRRDSEEARRRLEEEYRTRSAAVSYEGEEGKYFAKDDLNDLTGLLARYTPEEIGLLHWSGRIRLSASLQKQYALPRTPSLDKSLYRMEFVPDWRPQPDPEELLSRVAAYQQDIEEARAGALSTRRQKKQKQKLKKQRQAAIRTAIVNTIPDNYIDLFPLARGMRRHFVLHLGPTNSGKTYEALQALKAAESGIYLGPLRLLAFEQYEALNEAGCPCSLVTGEERMEVPFARHQASTVEMLNTKTEYDVAVIDEAQMISDPDRGGAWTRAILGACAREIHVCAAPIARGILLRLIRDCGDSCEIVRHERMTPLTVERRIYSLDKDVQPGDALIVFSRKSVHGIGSYLQRKGVKCSVIYGALPYDVRREQAQLFAEGQTQVVVATDAIGMGMNLPIRRVVFLEQQKFDGTAVRGLLTEEYKQIAGRAGRFGIYPEGFVSALENVSHVRAALNTPSATIRTAAIDFPESLLGIDAKLSEILERWSQIEIQPGYERADPTRMLRLCRLIEALSDDKRFLYDCISMTFDEEDGTLLALWRGMVEAEAAGQTFDVERELPDEKEIAANDRLHELESAFRRCDLLYGYCEKFGHTEYREEIMQRKNRISERMTQILARQALQERKCPVCGRVLPAGMPYKLCDRCFRQKIEERRKRRRGPAAEPMKR